MGIFGKKHDNDDDTLRKDMHTRAARWQQGGFGGELLYFRPRLGKPFASVLLSHGDRSALLPLAEIRLVLAGQASMAETVPGRETHFLMSVATHFAEDTDEVAFLGTRVPGWRDTGCELIASMTTGDLQDMFSWAGSAAEAEDSAREAAPA